jgi:alcohol dehydrogenase class IV
VTWDGVHTFQCPTRLHYGRGASAQTGERLGELGVTCALLVSDPGLAASGTVDAIAARIREAGIDVVVYADTESNPTTVNCEAAAALYRGEGCDGIVGLGGGSSMDCAKGAGILVANGGEIADYRGPDKVRERVPPLVCVPTTCGTGSEVTFVAVLTDPDDSFKLVVVSPMIAPYVSLVDPDLVQSAPAEVIAATGIDALAHAIESYVNKGSDPLLASIDIAAVRLIGRNLRAAVREKDPEAIAHMSLASTMAGVAFNMNANAIVHAASTPVTARYHVPHGVANGIFLPAGLAAIAAGCRRELGEIGEALGEDVAGLPEEAAAERCIEAVRRLCADIGIPATLAEWGLDPADVDVPRLVEDALKSRNIATNPIQVGPAELEELYRVVLGEAVGVR